VFCQSSYTTGAVKPCDKKGKEKTKGEKRRINTRPQLCSIPAPDTKGGKKEKKKRGKSSGKKEEREQMVKPWTAQVPILLFPDKGRCWEEKGSRKKKMRRQGKSAPRDSPNVTGGREEKKKRKKKGEGSNEFLIKEGGDSRSTHR